MISVISKYIFYRACLDKLRRLIQWVQYRTVNEFKNYKLKNNLERALLKARTEWSYAHWTHELVNIRISCILKKQWILVWICIKLEQINLVYQEVDVNSNNRKFKHVKNGYYLKNLSSSFPFHFEKNATPNR